MGNIDLFLNNYFCSDKFKLINIKMVKLYSIGGCISYFEVFIL